LIDPLLKLPPSSATAIALRAHGKEKARLHGKKDVIIIVSLFVVLFEFKN
jgi:hypothetical protein